MNLSLAPLDPQVNMLYCIFSRSRTRFHNHELCNMLQIKCHVNINRLTSVPRDLRLPSTDGACTDFQASQLPRMTGEQYKMQVA